ncbi:TetR/AcrR family transcriptional regulator [Streptomyces sp. CRN 30]|uniref:TetR/AcrR family transcriptional regulator n=1 Tax=Streptomyces sp. CRN 30 TaxID=3075613 RepID=UPI002A80671B|nr:TetR/AcrR family transcriptional regulator [Streptomyces sp. CRN 30]
MCTACGVRRLTASRPGGGGRGPGKYVIGPTAIAEQAGVSRATFYAHFHGKAEVLVHLADELRKSLPAPARQWEPGTGDDGLGRLTRFLTDVISLHRAHRGALGPGHCPAHRGRRRQRRRGPRPGNRRDLVVRRLPTAPFTGGGDKT